MVVSFIIALVFAKIESGLPQGQTAFDLGASGKLLVGIGITTLAWVVVTLLTPATDREVLRNFYAKIRPHAALWGPIAADFSVDDTLHPSSSLGREIAMMIIGCFAIYATLFAIGYALYSEWLSFIVATVIAVASFATIANLWPSKPSEV